MVRSSGELGKSRLLAAVKQKEVEVVVARRIFLKPLCLQGPGQILSFQHKLCEYVVQVRFQAQCLSAERRVRQPAHCIANIPRFCDEIGERRSDVLSNA